MISSLSSLELFRIVLASSLSIIELFLSSIGSLRISLISSLSSLELFRIVLASSLSIIELFLSSLDSSLSISTSLLILFSLIAWDSLITSLTSSPSIFELFPIVLASSLSIFELFLSALASSLSISSSFLVLFSLISTISLLSKYPYGYVVILSFACIFLSSLELSAILLTFSMYTLWWLLVNWWYFYLFITKKYINVIIKSNLIFYYTFLCTLSFVINYPTHWIIIISKTIK